MKYKKGDRVVFQPITVEYMGSRVKMGPKFYCKIEKVIEKPITSFCFMEDDYIIISRNGSTQHVREREIRKAKRYEYFMYLFPDTAIEYG